MSVLADAPHALYRFFDQSGALLYVGLTANPGARLNEHRGQPWWSEVANVTLETFPSRETVTEAERTAIGSEKPRYNIQLADGPTSVRTVRMPVALWEAARDRAWERRQRGGVSAPIRLALSAYVADPDGFEAACRRIVGVS